MAEETLKKDTESEQSKRWKQIRAAETQEKMLPILFEYYKYATTEGEFMRVELMAPEGHQLAQDANASLCEKRNKLR